MSRISPATKAALIAVLLAIATFGLIALSAMRAAKHPCEVCITYRGQTMCRSALGATREEAIKTATDNACSFLASGMTENIECSNTRPASVECGEE